MGKIVKYDRQRIRLIVKLIPVTILVMALALYLLNRTGIIEKKFNVGYEGPMKLVPEVRILDEKTGDEKGTMEYYTPMVGREMVTGEGSDDGIEEAPDTLASDIETPLPDEISIDSERFLRTYPARAEVPYSREYVILKMVKPDYPQDALAKGIEGYVIIEAHVGEDGKVRSVYARKVFGAESFKDASLQAVSNFEFKPKRENGRPASFWVSFIVRFTFNARRQTFER